MFKLIATHIDVLRTWDFLYKCNIVNGVSSCVNTCIDKLLNSKINQIELMFVFPIVVSVDTFIYGGTHLLALFVLI